MTAPLRRPTTSLEALTDLLDLQPAHGSSTSPDRVNLGLVAGRSGPRFLVPTDFPHAAPQACLAYLGLRDTRTRVARGAVGLAIKARMGRVVLRQKLTADAGPGSLIAVLDELLADPEHEPGLAVAAGMGHLDEVWKPTLQLFRPDGTPAAFVKIGLGPVAAQLVTTEAETLAAWAHHPDPRLVVPAPIAHLTWNDLPIVVVAPLPSDARRLPPGIPSAWPVRELDGDPQHLALGDATWWTGRRTECAGEPAVDGLLDQIHERHQDLTTDWARWHGDWVPWNLARCHRGLVAWDWEYAEPGAPVGLDEVHGAYQQAHVVGGASIADALAVARAAASGFTSAAPTDASPSALRARAGTPAPERGAAPTPDPRAARWLADAHVAMLVTRSAQLGRLIGHPPAHHRELLEAASEAIAAPVLAVTGS